MYPGHPKRVLGPKKRLAAQTPQNSPQNSIFPSSPHPVFLFLFSSFFLNFFPAHAGRSKMAVIMRMGVC
jgi:hypothetical protein